MQTSNPIESFKFWCQYTLPLVYTDSLSYYETLCAMASKLNDVIDYVDSLVNTDHSYTDAQIAVLKDYVDSQDRKNSKEIYQRIQLIENDFMNQLTETKMYVDDKISDFNEIFNNRLENEHLLLAKEIAEFKDEIYKLISKFETNCISPVSGTKMSFCEALEEVYVALNVYGLTAIEYDTLNLTSSQYDNKNITAWQYDVLGKKFLGEGLCMCNVYSSITGLLTPVGTAIQQVLNYLSQPITASAYDALKITATAYNNKNISALYYDTQGNKITN